MKNLRAMRRAALEKLRARGFKVSSRQDVLHWADAAQPDERHTLFIHWYDPLSLKKSVVRIYVDHYSYVSRWGLG